MKTKTLTILSVLLFSVLSVPAITLDELAGVYVGKRTETYPTFVMRYEEVTVIESDGWVTNYVFSDELPEPFISSGLLVIEEDGTFFAGDNGLGQLSLHGKHLTLTVQWSQPEVTVHFKGHRTEKDIPLPDIGQ